MSNKEKKCFKCELVKPLTEFYKHSQMADGHVNKCKECNKLDVRLNRKDKIDYYREYDRNRGCRQSKEYAKSYREKYKNKYKATSMVNYAIRSKKLFKEPCEVCGTDKNIHAHHDDYLKPLNVRWLCAVHHKQWHDKNGEALNGN
ncbi:MAG: hypothetical protein KDI76_14010 [Xanthomonadales bacterium]|nr:hypothetical protein [Xanthomonadales bacterium]